ncbi:hypothetical protein [Saccharolobus caldissimus]|uniref:Uncharacterized protein n=1 Tax=Saccharolobus caldissimus TaxID=1702097 RepID=A0AAQ4CRU9_9CREN|nr:hypothetical protein [Saccharolobus caldissimus]BDB98530.1 hypothetical protein SACC_15470 [Saccharolobus caldissimus]
MDESYIVLLDENGEVLGEFRDVESLYAFVKEKMKEGKKIKIKGPIEVYFLL